MTIKEFSDKYQIPYNIAYKASYVVKPIPRYDVEYDEQALLDETLKHVRARLKLLKFQCNQYETALKNLGGT